MKYLLKFNPIRFIATHLIGKNHTIHHRIVIGSLIICLAYLLVSYVEIKAIHYAVEGFSEIMKGCGAMPFLELIENSAD